MIPRSQRLWSRREFGLAIVGAVPVVPALLQPKLRIDAPRLMRHIEGLAQFGANPEGGVSRVAYSEADRRGREYVVGLMREAGLETSIDAAGNIAGRRTGSRTDLGPLAMGSHIDSVPQGGNYDGTVGSLSAIEAAQTLAENGIATRHPIEVLVFQNEEGGQFGSRLMIGSVQEKQLEAVTYSGKTVREGIRTIGGDPERFAAARRMPGSLAGYLEVHIEQGGVLESERCRIGIVEGIVGINRHEVTIEGFANHAGTTPMNLRRDALLSAAKLIEAVNEIVTSIPGRQVGTVGKIEAVPGAPNVIPGRVDLTIELRDLDWEKIQTIRRKIGEASVRIGEATRTEIRFREIYANHPAPCDERMRRAIADSAEELGIPAISMPSGAGHDAQGISRLCPIGMIFIPSVGGISHSPREYSKPEDIRCGADVLLHSLLRLDRIL